MSLSREVLRKNAGLLIIGALTIAGSWFAVYYQQQKIVVVDAVKLFNGYKMKQELEAKDNHQLEVYKRSVDSLKEAVNLMLQAKADSSHLRPLIQEYRADRLQLESAYEESNKNINEQVWKRLNPEIDAFGKSKGYRIMIGANGMGSVLYNDPSFHRTDELLKYVNDAYENN